MAIRIPFGDLKRQNDNLRIQIQNAVASVIDSGWYILGNEVTLLEQEFAEYCGVAHAVGVASGAEALYLALAALDIGPGDEVITVANACMYQVSAILQVGARPILVDVDKTTSTLDPKALYSAITPRTRAIIPVHLYGRLAAMNEIMALANAHNIPVIEDAAQAHGAWQLDGDNTMRRAGAWGCMGCFSFYPSKNLGALGDAGMVITNDVVMASRLRQLRMYGWDTKYHTVDVSGRNSRLDEIQAAILRVKLRYLEASNAARRERAVWYRELLNDIPLRLPHDENGHVYHLYVVVAEERDVLRRHLIEHGIGCDVHYPFPAHLQPAYSHLGYTPGSFPVTEHLANHILSLPLFAELTRDEIEQVCAAIRIALR